MQVLLPFLFFAGALSFPVLDLESTKVALLHSGTKDHHHFLVSVFSVDDYYKLDGDHVGEELSLVQLSFDVDQSLKLRLNNVSVPVVGISDLDVSAQVMFHNGTDAYFADKVKVKIGFKMERVFENNTYITRLNVKEKIISIDGVEVSQPRVVGQVIDISDDGTAAHYEPNVLGDEENNAINVANLEQENEMSSRLSGWLERHSLFFQIMVGAFAGFIFSCLCIGLYELVFALYLKFTGATRYDVLPAYDHVVADKKHIEDPEKAPLKE